MCCSARLPHKSQLWTPKIDLCGGQWCRCCARGRIWVKTCNICVISGLFCVILCVLWQSPLIRVWRQSHKSQIPGKNRFVRRVDETPACAEPMLSAGACSSKNKKWSGRSRRTAQTTARKLAFRPARRAARVAAVRVSSRRRTHTRRDCRWRQSRDGMAR